ncbi:Uncharacterised protein [Candidatus Tiddalikarchaeum anstoanum]|nr:Uncharacterised protein [Candidatus Tiddalikarchaeum anstoanum]
MVQSCNACNCNLVDNENSLDVLAKLRSHKSAKINEKFPMLIADFYCQNTKNQSCDFNLHIMWKDIDNDINVLKCPKCGGQVLSSIFLGVISGFYLESFCFNCLSRRNGGNIAYQK